MGKWEVAIITLLVSFKFSSGIFNHCSANMLQTKETPIRKTIIIRIDNISLVIKKKSSSCLVPV